MLDILLASLLSPVVLAFALGALAVAVKSDLELPDPLYQALSIYLLLAIGLKGGVEVSKAGFGTELLVALAAGLVYGATKGPELRVITCGGTYDENARRHLDNVIVFAELVDE